jgi:hypothetical protein
MLQLDPSTLAYWEKAEAAPLLIGKEPLASRFCLSKDTTKKESRPEYLIGILLKPPLFVAGCTYRKSVIF